MAIVKRTDGSLLCFIRSETRRGATGAIEYLEIEPSEAKLRALLTEPFEAFLHRIVFGPCM